MSRATEETWPAERIVYRRGGDEYLVPVGRVHPTGMGLLNIRDAGGSGRPVVLLHGWGVDSLINWAGVVGVLEHRWRTILVDLPGHGGSTIEGRFTIEKVAGAIAEALDDLDVNQAVVCGYSLGGAVMLALTRSRPDIVAGVVAVATAARFTTFAKRGVEFAGMMLELVGGRETPWEEKAVVLHGEHLGRAVFNHDAAALGGALREAAKFDGREVARALQKPSASIITKFDSVVRFELQQELAQIFGTVPFIVPDGHGYCLKNTFGEDLSAAVETVERSLSGR